MKKVLTVGGATIDIYLHYEGADFMSINQKNQIFNYMLFKSGEKIEVENILYFTGGGATNSSVSFKRLGFDTTCFCQVGKNSEGKEIIKELEGEGIDISKIIISEQYPSGKSFIINSLKKERTIFAYRGANGFLDANKIPFNEIKNSNQIYITSLSYNSSNLLPNIVEFAHKNNIPVAINPGISQLANGTKKLKESLKYIDIIILNSSEAKTFMIALTKDDEEYKKAFESSKNKTKITLFDKTNEIPYLLKTPFIYENFYFSIRKFFKEIIKMGPKIVVITNGENGVYVCTKNELLFHPSIKTEIRDTLGAGDAFGSCFVGSILHGNNIEDSLKYGIINSSSVIGQIGAKPGLLTYKKLKEKAKKLDTNLMQKFSI